MRALRETRCGVSPSSRRCTERGFTLIEVMVVIALIAVLSTLALLRVDKWTLQGRLQYAVPVITDLSTRVQRYHQQYGVYPSFDDEDAMLAALGGEVSSLGEFCFMVRNSGFLSSPEETPSFEIWAVLVSEGGAGPRSVNVDHPNVISCRTASDKRAAASDFNDLAGRIVALRHPQPTNGIELGQRTGRVGVYLDWVGGVTVTDPLQEE